MFNKTLSAILRGIWLIDEQFAMAHLPVIVNMINGKLSGQEFLKGDGEFEIPFIMQENGKIVPAYITDPETFKLRLNTEAFTPNYVSVVPFVGPVTKYNGACGEPGLIKRQGWILETVNNPNCAGYISIIDSPGGQADGTPQTAATISSIDVPTAAQVVGGAYSAGAWIASGHKSTYAADKYAEFGSIGAYTTFVDYTEYFQKQGIKVESVYPDVSKDKNLSYRKAQKGDTSMLKAEVEELALWFIEAFAENRSGKLKSSDWNTGKTFGAEESIKMGLIDGIMPLMDIASSLRSQSKKSITIIKNPDMDISKIKALAGQEAPSQEVLDSANAELTTAGITHVTLVQESVLSEATAVTKERDQLKADKNSLTEQLSKVNTAKDKAEKDLADANAKIKSDGEEIASLKSRIAKGPGATHVPSGGNDDPTQLEADEDLEKVLSAMPHNKKADGLFGE